LIQRILDFRFRRSGEFDLDYILLDLHFPDRGRGEFLALEIFETVFVFSASETTSFTSPRRFPNHCSQPAYDVGG